MVAATLIALAIFLVLVAGVLALARVQRLSLIGLAAALTFFVAGAALAVVGQRKYDSCQRNALANIPTHTVTHDTLNDRIQRSLEGDTSSGDEVVRGSPDFSGCHAAQHGLHDPF